MKCRSRIAAASTRSPDSSSADKNRPAAARRARRLGHGHSFRSGPKARILLLGWASRDPDNQADRTDWFLTG
ncbi:MAG: hypothetical protein OXL98_12920 [Acidimicrobiaceae bacterium]|nr:hypothetical protein [Acidimicrobiaceae bacterium]